MLRFKDHEVVPVDVRPCLKKGCSLYGKQLFTEFVVESGGKKFYGHPGDFILVDSSGKVYICSEENFEKYYDWIHI
jgi:hypothetical protein